MFPGRVRQEILQHLLITVRNRFGHPLHVCASPLASDAQILLRRLDHAVVAGAEELAKLIAEFLICHAQPSSGLVMANPFLSHASVNFNMIL